MKMNQGVTDGVYAHYIHRPLARAAVGYVPSFVTANCITVISFLVGVSAAVAVVERHLITAIALIQVFCVLSCLDGEVARRGSHASKKGDFLDTMTDRSIEYIMICALIDSIWRETLAGNHPLYAIFFAFYLITYSAEKYRSTFKSGFPKGRDGLFVYVSSGVDARMTMYCIALGIGVVLPGQRWSEYFFILLQCIIAANVLYRLALILSLPEPQSGPGHINVLPRERIDTAGSTAPSEQHVV